VERGQETRLNVFEGEKMLRAALTAKLVSIEGCVKYPEEIGVN